MTAAVEATLARTKKGKGPARPGARRQAHNPPPQGNWGPDTAPQMRHAEIVPMHKGNWFFKRRSHPLQIMAKPHGRRRQADITVRERNAGMAVVELVEATQRSTGLTWNKVYVDASPKPGDVDVKRLDAQGKLKRMRAVVPREAWPVVNHVVFNEGLIRRELTSDPDRQRYWLGRLRAVLERWADILGY